MFNEIKSFRNKEFLRLKNIFGPVYVDAIMENQAEEVQISLISYPDSIGLNLANNLYAPKILIKAKRIR